MVQALNVCPVRRRIIFSGFFKGFRRYHTTHGVARSAEGSLTKKIRRRKHFFGQGKLGIYHRNYWLEGLIFAAMLRNFNYCALLLVCCAERHKHEHSARKKSFNRFGNIVGVYRIQMIRNIKQTHAYGAVVFFHHRIKDSLRR